MAVMQFFLFEKRLSVGPLSTKSIQENASFAAFLGHTRRQIAIDSACLFQEKKSHKNASLCIQEITFVIKNFPPYHQVAR
jgi:hypothetical protein